MGPGPRWVRLFVCVGVAGILWGLPSPEGLPREGWQTFAVFAGVISAFLLRPIAMAPAVLLGLIVLVLAGTVDAGDAIAEGFGDKTVWLVVAAFLVAGAVDRTGLGRRIALHLIRILGRSMLGLGYAIAATELALGPFIPSNTARGGGIISPVVWSVARTLGAVPDTPTARTGAFLAQTGSHANLVCSAMFLTAMAGNPLVAVEAERIFGVDWSFASWLLGSIVPGLAGLAAVPLVMYLLQPPDSHDVSRVRARVRDEIEALGPWTRRELTLVAILLALLALWSTKSFHGIDTTVIAFMGILAIVLTDTQEWRDIAATWGAWDALIWLGGFVALAEALIATGFTTWLQDVIGGHLSGFSPVATTIAIGLIYFATMLFFSQLTAHITALAAVFLTLAASASSPPFLAVAIISYFSCLCGTMTPWSSGPVIIYFGFGYVSVGRWMINGCSMAVVQIAIWLGLGLGWWKLLEWW